MPEPKTPSFRSDSFSCPHCGVYAHQEWAKIESEYLEFHYMPGHTHLRIGEEDVWYSLCAHCENPAFWQGPRIVFPTEGVYPPANRDMPDNVKEVYDEAGAIAVLSPRAACALLRLALQLLLLQLGESGNINSAINNLVGKGLDPRIKNAMHILRVTGNHAVHPGKITFDSDTDIHGLFNLLNAIVYDQITTPRERDEMYNSLPESDRANIAKKEGEAKR